MVSGSRIKMKSITLTSNNLLDSLNLLEFGMFTLPDVEDGVLNCRVGAVVVAAGVAPKLNPGVPPLVLQNL
jgi:hypothetical protein